jgi:virginiamycin B lyase
MLECLEDRWLPSVSIHEFGGLTAKSSPSGITSGPDGNLWFGELTSGKVGVINPTTHAVSEFSVPSGSSVKGITAGPDGNLWFTEFSAGNIGEINPTTHAVNEFSTPTPKSQPVEITVGPDGNLWFTESGAD